MHWATPIVIIWVIEFAGFIILSRGILLLSQAIKRVEENLKKPLIAILISFSIYLILGIYVTIAVTQQFNYESFLWTGIFILGFFVSIFLVIGGRKLLREIEKS